jgi:hypothetical protein
MKNGQARDKGKWRMDKSETKANEEWTSQRQRQMKNGQARDKGKCVTSTLYSLSPVNRLQYICLFKRTWYNEI